MAMVAIETAPDAWKLLNGIVCTYKLAKMTTHTHRSAFANSLCRDLNAMKGRPPSTVVEIRKVPKIGPPIKQYGRNPVACIPVGEEKIEVITGFNYADHPLVVGPRYIKDDFRLSVANSIGSRASGVCVMGVNNACGTAKKIRSSMWLRTYELSGRFGIATDNTFEDGRVVEKSTYHKITHHLLERIVALTQANHQKQMYNVSGIPMGSQLAYDMASRGAIRPTDTFIPVIYGLKLIDFNLPEFKLEVKVINETQEYLAELLQGIALKLHSTAVCTGLRCTKFGPFDVEHALLTKHWTVEHVIRNMSQCKEVIKDFDLRSRDPIVRGSGHVEFSEKLENVLDDSNSLSK